MVYVPKTWVNGDALPASEMNRIEGGVSEAISSAAASAAAAEAAAASAAETEAGAGLHLDGQVTTYSALPADAPNGQTWLVSSTSKAYVRSSGAWPPEAEGASVVGPAGSNSWEDITGKPSSFPPNDVVTPATGTALNSKVSVVSSPYRLYGTGDSGQPFSYVIDGSSPTPGTIPLRDGSGNIPGVRASPPLNDKMTDRRETGWVPAVDMNGAVQQSNSWNVLTNLAYNDDPAKVRWSGGVCSLVTAGDHGNGAHSRITGCTSQPRASYAVETIHDGNNVNILFSNSISQNNDITVWVDGLLLGLGSTAGQTTSRMVFASGANQQVSIQFTVARPRHIRVAMSRDMAFVAFTGSGRFVAPSGAGVPRCAIVGDSYISGINTTADGTVFSRGIAHQLAAITGWDVFPMSVAGSGYNTQTASDATSPYASTARKNALTALGNLDVIVFWGTINDTGQTQSAINTATNDAWSAARAAYPDATIVVVGAESGVNSSYNTVANLIKNSALAAVGNSIDAFLDLRADAILTGTGKSGSPTGDGTQDLLLSSDGLHLTVAGHDAHASWLIRRLAAVREH